MPVCVVIPKVLSLDECETVIELGRALPKYSGEQSVEARYGAPAETRRCRLGWFPPDAPECAFVYRKLDAAVLKANDANWQFKLDGEREHAQFTEYNEQDRFEWHMDAGDSTRKLTCVIHLNPRQEYEGGELQLFYDREPRALPPTPGDLIIFPSYVMHRVSPITFGTRYTLVQWYSGVAPFR